jgi:hypothetical protein
MEIISTIEVRPRKSHSKSLVYLIGLLWAIYHVSDLERICKLFVSFLTWLDDLFVGDVEILM